MSKGVAHSDEGDMVNSRIERLAREAFGQAYQEALASEGGVIAVEEGVLYQVFQDGRKVKIKDIPPKIKLKPNVAYTLKA
ncbi:MAG: hypothetical protein ACSHX6_02285 [Akkermansiaceae bacterium]